MKPRGILLLSVCGIALSIRADTFVVTNTSDDGPGSFRQAILNAASNPGPDVITFSNATGQITLLSQLSVMGDVTVDGPGAHQLTVFCTVGTTTQPGIVIEPSATATISGLRLTGSFQYYRENGGAISNAGTLFLRDCELMSVQMYSAHGAAIYNTGNLFISGCTIANNAALATGQIYPIQSCTSAYGGGLYVASGSVVITNSTFSGNRATGFVGGYLSCSGRGGAIYAASGNLLLVNCTLADNGADAGGAIYGGDVTLLNCIVTDEIVVGSLNSSGKNLVTNTISAKLGPLQDNGGPTLTRALLDGSPAVDQGVSDAAPTVDQRGVTRPQGRRVDLGAFELEGVPFSFQLDVASNGSGTVSRDPGLLIFPSNAVVTLTATADEDYAFTEWSGDASGNTNPLLVSMDRDKSIVAKFQYSPATVTNAPGSTNFVINTNSWGPGSFRQAVRNLVASDGGCVLFSNVTGTIALPLGLPHLTADADIRGPGPENLVLKFPYGAEAFVFDAGATGIISGLTIQSAYSTNRSGGAINNAGNLQLERLHLLNCGSSTNGGAVFNSGNLQLRDCVFAQNNAPSGGAIYNQSNLLADGSEFIGNQSYARSQDYTSGGGAFYNASGEVEFTRCSFSNNTATGVSGGSENPSNINAGSGLGGAVYVLAGNVGFTDTLIAGNAALGESGGIYELNHYSGSGGSALGAGIYVRDGTASLTNCALVNNHGVAGNSAGASRFPGTGGIGEGGGIYVKAGNVFAANCTLSGNEVQSGSSGGGGLGPGPIPGGGLSGLGGAVYNDAGSIDLVSCTVADNRAFGGSYGGFFGTNFGRGIGGGIYVNTFGATGAVTLVSTIISGNSGAETGTNGIVADDGAGPISSLGYNLVGNVSGLSNFVASDLLNVDPRLGPLQDNGGATPTHALLASSAAIDAGVASGFLADQRGQPRTVDNPSISNRLGSDGTDIGAAEVNHVLRITDINRLGGNVLLKFTSVSDKAYRLEYKPDLSMSSWTPLPELVPGTGGIVTLTNNETGMLTTRFYRVFERPP